MKDGKCPKCGSTNIYMRREGISFYFGSNIPPGIFIVTGRIVTQSKLDNYICTDCGYFESYIVDKDKLEEVAENWDKID